MKLKWWEYPLLPIGLIGLTVLAYYERWHSRRWEQKQKCPRCGRRRSKSMGCPDQCKSLEERNRGSTEHTQYIHDLVHGKKSRE